MTTNLTIIGMTCGHCQHAVRKALQGVPGVTDAVVDLTPARPSCTVESPTMRSRRPSRTPATKRRRRTPDERVLPDVVRTVEAPAPASCLHLDDATRYRP